MSPNSVITGAEFDRQELRKEIGLVAAELLSTRSTSAHVRALAETGNGLDPELWRQFADMGWLGLETPDEYGGGDGTFGDLAVILTAMGKHLCGNGFVASTVLGMGGLLAAENRGLAVPWIAQVISGAARATATSSAGRATLECVADESGWVINGATPCVADAEDADLVVLAAHAGDGGDIVFAVEAGVPGLSLTPAPMLDVTRRFADLSASGLRLPSTAVLADGDAAATMVARMRNRAALAMACDALGTAERALKLTVDHAKTRVQFGRPIGSFQAVKHRCTDMYICVETARAALDESIDAYDAAPDESTAAASRAKAYCCDAASQVAEDGLEMLGGIGFTWEHDMHLLLKRARLDQALYGDSRWHRRRVADLTF